jgi:carboxyl-terminal processing protease
MEELDDWQDLQAADLNSRDEEADFVIREGGQIMADMLELDRRTAALPAMDPSLTAKAQTARVSTDL